MIDNDPKGELLKLKEKGSQTRTFSGNKKPWLKAAAARVTEFLRRLAEGTDRLPGQESVEIIKSKRDRDRVNDVHKIKRPAKGDERRCFVGAAKGEKEKRVFHELNGAFSKNGQERKGRSKLSETAEENTKKEA